MIKKDLVKHEFIEKEFLKELEWNSIPPDRAVWSQRDWDETLVTKITMVSNSIHKNTYQGGADTIRIGNEIWMMGLYGYSPQHNQWFIGNRRKVGNLCGRWEVYLDENVPYNEIWVSREQPTYGIILEDTEGDMPTMRFNYGHMFDKKKLTGRIKINE